MIITGCFNQVYSDNSEPKPDIYIYMIKFRNTVVNGVDHVGADSVTVKKS